MSSRLLNMSVASIYEERDRLLSSGGDFEPGVTAGKIDELTLFAKGLIKVQGNWSFGSGPVSAHVVENVLNDLRYDLMDWRGIVGLFLPDAVSLVTDDSRVVISLGQFQFTAGPIRRPIKKRPTLVILGCDDGVYNLLDLDSAKTMKASSIQVAAHVIAAGVEYL